MTLAISTSTTWRRMNPTWMWNSLALWAQQIRGCRTQWAVLSVLGTISLCWEVITGKYRQDRLFCANSTVFREVSKRYFCKVIYDCFSTVTALLLDQWVAMPGSVLTCALSGLMLMQILIHPRLLHQETSMVYLWHSCWRNCKTRCGKTFSFAKIYI